MDNTALVLVCIGMSVWVMIAIGIYVLNSPKSVKCPDCGWVMYYLCKTSSGYRYYCKRPKCGQCMSINKTTGNRVALRAHKYKPPAGDSR